MKERGTEKETAGIDDVKEREGGGEKCGRRKEGLKDMRY